MLRILKMGPHHQLQRSKEWTCCFGVHVQTATIIIGLWYLFLNIFALSLLAIIIRNPQMVEELQNNYDYTVDLTAPALPTPLSKIDSPYAYSDRSVIYQEYHSYDMGGLVCTCMIAITMMMIYGAIKGKPSHLLPFFCLQLIDFAITTLTAAGYLCYLQTINRLIAESHRLPWREKLLELPTDVLAIVVLAVFLWIVYLKAYAIGIVWRCYKYLALRQQSIRSSLPFDISNISNTNTLNEERGHSTLLPNYEESVAQYLKQAPPPSYQVAMSNYQYHLEQQQNGNLQQQQVYINNLNLSTIDEETNNNVNLNNNNTNNLPTNANTFAIPSNDYNPVDNNNFSPPPDYSEISMNNDVISIHPKTTRTTTIKTNESQA